MINCAAIGHILADKRGVDAEIASIACSIHDIGRILTGKQKGHAEAADGPIQIFLKDTGIFTSEEIEILTLATINHSDKINIGTPIQEIVKDADVLSCYQYDSPLERQE